MDNKKTALVLSGGGALGAYEIGVWKALIKLGYEFNIATGTSVGALNAIMVVQKDFKKAYNIWRNISFADIYEEKIDKNISAVALYKKYAKEIVQNGGMNPSVLENLLHKVYNEKKFYASDIDYGLITFNLSTMKPEIKRKKDINPKDLVNYAIASATCFPAFKVKTIDNEKYIDGGYYDNLPINLAIDMGATNIVAVDLKAIGMKRKTKKFKGNITIISPNNKLLSMLDFNAKKARQAIKFGYNDTMKKFNKLEGFKYTFKKDELAKHWDKFSQKYLKYLNTLTLAKKLKTADLIIDKGSDLILDDEKHKIKFYELMEYCGYLFNLPEEQIYDIKTYNKKLYQELEKTESLDLKNLVKNIKDIFDKRRIIKTIYDYIDDPNSLKSLHIVADIFTKEFKDALYLKILF